MTLHLSYRFLTLGVITAYLGFAQPALQPAFEVASIKPNRTGARNSGFRRAGPGALNATNVTLKMLISFAYEVRDHQISGGPDWIDSERYDILAKSEDGAGTQARTTEERNALLRLRVQKLLADRFQLTLHRTTRELPMFALVVGKNGTKQLHPAMGSGSELVTNGHHLTCRQITMATFARTFLQSELGRSVVDRTGLTGEFDFTLDWVRDEAQHRLADLETDAPAAAGGEGPSFFTALQEQLGLKLEPAKGPVEILVIDRAERASEN